MSKLIKQYLADKQYKKEIKYNTELAEAMSALTLVRKYLLWGDVLTVPYIVNKYSFELNENFKQFLSDTGTRVSYTKRTAYEEGTVLPFKFQYLHELAKANKEVYIYNRKEGLVAKATSFEVILYKFLQALYVLSCISLVVSGLGMMYLSYLWVQSNGESTLSGYLSLSPFITFILFSFVLFLKCCNQQEVYLGLVSDKVVSEIYNQSN